MSNLTKEAIEAIDRIVPDLTPIHEAYKNGIKDGLTNPTIYQAAGLIEFIEMDEFMKWCILSGWHFYADGNWGNRLYSDTYTTTDLLTIFRQQKEVK